jgi:hypothetical protein
MKHNPLRVALWLLIAGLSFGLSLGWPWLVLLGLIGPVVWLTASLVWNALQ